MYIGTKSRSQLEANLIVDPPDPARVDALNVVDWPDGLWIQENLDQSRVFIGPWEWPWGECVEFEDSAPRDIDWARRKLLCRMTSRFEFEEVPVGRRLVALAVLGQPGRPPRLYCIGRDSGVAL